MDICANQICSEEKTRPAAPVIVPLALVAIGAVLLPFDCVYNQVLAISLIGIGGYSLFKRLKKNYCCKKQQLEVES